jgi:hypothetical protein
MISMARPVRRQTDTPYKHYRKQIVVELYNDTIALRLKKTRKRYEIPVTHLLDYLCRREAFRIQMERAKQRKQRKRK